MKVLYVARHHQQTGADDEGAITHAFRELGHSVTLVQEGSSIPSGGDWDLLLFHKWNDLEERRKLSVGRTVCWWFDLVNWPQDPTLQRRSANRVAWMKRHCPTIDLLCCTDGDWVESVQRFHWGPKKARWLPQGADGRIVGMGTQRGPSIPILFTGIGKGGGIERESFIAEMSERFGSQFMHFSGGIYRTLLKDVIRSSTLVVCPDSPVTDRYWSNRVYNACGFGGVVLHPYCRRLVGQYQDGSEILYYPDRASLYSRIEDILGRGRKEAGFLESIREAALVRTRRENLYRHRVEQMLEWID